MTRLGASRLRELAEDRPLARAAVITLGALWCLMPLWLLDRTPADAVPVLVAGHMVDDAPDQIYSDGGVNDVEPVARARLCEFYDTRHDCVHNTNAFVSPPAAIPVAGVLALLPDDLGLAIIRIVAAVGAALALALLWHDHAGRSALAPASIVLTGVALTPIVAYSVGLGQTSPLYLLAAVAGVPALAGRGLVTTVAWGWLSVMKLFPYLAVVGVRGRGAQRAAAAVAAALAVLTLIGLWWAGWSRLGEFVSTTRAIAADARDANASGGIETVARDLLGRGVAPYVAIAWRLGIGVALVTGCRRLRDAQVTWAAALFFTVVAIPQVWTHYLVVVAGLGAALAHRVGLRALVVGALATTPAMVALVPGGLPLSYVVAVTLLVAAAAFVAWAYSSAPREPGPVDGADPASRVDEPASA